MTQRFPQSGLAYGEFITGKDGKMRYFKPLRTRLYRRMVSWIRDVDPEICVYFCMEDDEVWQRAAGFRPSQQGGLPRILDRRAARCCRLRNPI